MCSFLVSNKSDIKLLNKANYYIKNRGPDHTSFSDSLGITFIHNLLSITGNFTPQPFVDVANKIVCVYNGEIYNAFDLNLNYNTDGECLIPLYKKYGDSFATKLDGEFAVCLVDFKHNKIILASDTFLTKPLWYGKNGEDFVVGSYKSSVTLAGVEKAYRMPANTYKVFDLKLNELYSKPVKTFSLDQHKTSYDDWVNAFEKAISKRANKHVSKQIFLGLSSGYDSGAIACELTKQNIKYKAYSVSANENNVILNKRIDIIKKTAEIDLLQNCNEKFIQARQHINLHVEPYVYEIFSSRSNYTEYVNLHDDGGANAFSLVCMHAKTDGKKIYISGSGADEIFSDYGWQGEGKAKHSNFGGLFPEDLSTIWPWPSFYGSSQISYLTKEEMVGGSYGIECRYPFLDFNVVQEFLWLSAKLKNNNYKSVLDFYMTNNNFPFEKNKKIGFYY
jgi:asparagine synthetase B (glutamine-hydrolysing)